MQNLQEVDENAGGDTLDAKTFFSSTFGRHHISSGILPTHIHSDRYNMTHANRGLCIIFNHKVFYPHTKMDERKGTDEDAKTLNLRFRELDFDVKVYDDRTVKEILKIIEEAGKRDFTNDDCFVCCILSHGDEYILYGKDGMYDKEKLFEHFKGDVCPSLVGKPKIFLIQACQGTKQDDGVMLRSMGVDSPDCPGMVRVPIHADFLIAYSSVPGHYAWRHTKNGSCRECVTSSRKKDVPAIS